MSERRKIFGEKLVDLGNYTMVALIFGQLAVSNKDFGIIALGLFAALILYATAGMLLGKMKGGRKQ